MRGILADNDVSGYLDLLVQIWLSPAWLDVWNDLGLTVHTFRDLGLDEETTDAHVWQKCQDLEIVLVTANRNDDGPDSLQATIFKANTATNLPVFTLANVNRIRASKSYAKEVAIKTLEYLLDIEKYRGVGRIYVP